MNKVSADTQSDLDILSFTNLVLDKVIAIISGPNYGNRIQYREVDISRKDPVNCWVLPFSSKVLGKSLKFDLVFYTKSSLENASHISQVSVPDLIVLNILSKNPTFAPDPKLLVKKLSNNMIRRSFIHELIHYLIARRFVSKRAYIDYQSVPGVEKFKRMNKSASKQELENFRYYNEPTEMNTHYFEIIHDAKLLHADDPEDARFETFDTFFRFAETVHMDAFFEHLTPNNKKRLKKRLYQFYVALKSAGVAQSSERFRRQMEILAPKRRSMSLSQVLARVNIPHVVVLGARLGRPLAGTTGFEIFTNLRLNQKRTVTFGDLFRRFCKSFRISTEAVELPNDSIHTPYKFSFTNNSGSIILWTERHPVYDKGDIGQAFLKVEPTSQFKFGAIRSGLKTVSNIKPSYTKVTKDDVYRELALMLNEKPDEVNPTSEQEHRAYDRVIKKLASGKPQKLEEIQEEYFGTQNTPTKENR